ncbi:hypothetical protein Syun_015761 [Stephania yunnanensis]|uniref:Tetratricopeptide SHNi-TPR domain-containing protein n=1 Tax=Stephania yunnanensis TaxID=152371 RepID=A0AAP0JLT2_9MAGN
MAASDEASAITSLETPAAEEKEVAVETLASTEAQAVTGSHGNEESTCGTAQPSSSSPSANAEKDETKTLEFAAELVEKGSDAMKAGDYSEAAECFSRAVEIRVSHYNEMAPECSSVYYKYGCALLYKAQEEADPLGSVPKKETESVAKGESSTAVAVADVQQDLDAVPNKEENNGASGKDRAEEADEEDEEESEAEDLAEHDEDESDLDLAWKMLDLARAIVEKNPDDTMEKVDILSALGEVALEREDIETSLNDYMTALSMLERLVEKDSRHIAELNFRICLVLEVGSRAKEAIPFCEKAISVCKARILRLTDEVKGAAPPAETAVSAVDQVDKAVDASLSDSDKEAEITTLTGLSSELEKKLEDLQQLVSQPSSLLSEVLSMISAKASNSGGKTLNSTALSSSRIGTNDSGGDFDSPTVSTAHTNGNTVTHLGVVGRGVKRVLTNSNSEGSSSVKKPATEGKGKDNVA